MLGFKPKILRRRSKKIYVGKVPIGGDSPISVQSMTNTKTTDIANTVKQIRSLEKAGADIIRISIPSMKSVKALKEIKKQVSIPLIADIHFNYRIAIKAAECDVDCLRINPGNINNKKHIKSIIDCAKEKNIPIRIGINAGSLNFNIKKKYNILTPEILLESVMYTVDIFDKSNFDNFKVSVKSSDVLLTIQTYKLVASRIEQPLHLGITESGTIRNGTIKSAIGLGILLYEGIGDTIRVSLAADPIEEIRVGFNILQSLSIRKRGINFIACPTCSRKEFDVINTVNELERRLEDILIPMDISIIGCTVNGPGEAKMSSIGVTGHRKKSKLYEDGIQQEEYLNNESMVDQLEKRIRKKALDMEKSSKILIYEKKENQ